MKPYLAGILFFWFCVSLFAPAGARAELPFEDLSMKFEVNETDGDGEVVFSLKAPQGLQWLQVSAPDHEIIVFLMSNDERKGLDPVGLAQFKLETGEPSIEGVKKAYPDGTYEFLGKTISGERVVGRIDFSSKRLPAPSFSPKDAKAVDRNYAVIKWQPVEGAEAYEVEIENDDLEVNLTARLPESTDHFNIPREFLLPGTEYDISVATVSKDGNLSVAESSFETAE